MDDLAKKLTELLESEEGLNTVKSIADSLLSKDAPVTESEGPELPFSGGEMQMMMKLASALKSNVSDDRSALLLALKPHLSERRRDKVDEAVRLLRLVSLMPLIKESGIF